VTKPAITAAHPIRIANAPCSWGAFELAGDGEQPPGERVVAEMAEAGYVGTELGDPGFLGASPQAVRRTLAAPGLALVGGFVPIALGERAAHAEGIERAVATARLMAAVADDAVIVLSDDNARDPVRTQRAGRIGPEHAMSEAAWTTFAAGAEAVARAVKEVTGLRTVFHHHCAGYIETPAEIDRLLAATRPDLLGLCLDTGHVTFGGGDAVAIARRHADRIWHVHFKDCDSAVATAARDEGLDYFEAVRRGVFCELGRGAVEFPALIALLRDRSYAGWIVVEQDVFPGMGDPLGSARRSRAYLAERGL
jgi:inosose dehydratase